jgi:hypothetical protein
MNATIRTRLERAEQKLRSWTLARPNPLLQALPNDPTRIMRRAGMIPDPWQRDLLLSTCHRILLLCSRQAGKSTAVSALALHEALTRAGSLTLLLSPSQRQSGELFRKVLELFGALGRPMAALAESMLKLELANGSRIISLPGTEEKIRCYSGVRLLVIDEASRVENPLYAAVRPMLAVSRGRLIALSTPFGKCGWFHDAWHGNGPWQRIKVTAQECPRISKEFLREEREALGPRWFAMEYECAFQDLVGQIFAEEDIQSLFRGSSVAPLVLQ